MFVRSTINNSFIFRYYCSRMSFFCKLSEESESVVFFFFFFFAFNFTPICALFQGTYIVLQTINDCIYMKSKISIQEENLYLS